VLDLYRNHHICICTQLSLVDDGSISTDIYILGVANTMIEALSMTITAERMELSSVYLASIQKDIHLIIQMPHLPKQAFPLMAMLIDVATHLSERKPRIPLAMHSLQNQDIFNLADFAAYNKIVQIYKDVCGSE
jgi:FMN reductase (NADPH)